MGLWLAVALCAVALAQDVPGGPLDQETTASFLEVLTTALEVSVLLAGLGVLGGGAFLWWRARHHGYAPRVRTGAVGRRLRLLQRITVGGELVDPAPLRSPLGELDCLAWKIEVYACWWGDGEARQLKLFEDARTAPITLDDGSGPVVLEPGVDDALEWVPSYDREHEWSLLDAVLGHPLEVLPGRKIALPPERKAELPARIEALRRVEHVLPVSHRYVATGVARPSGRVAAGGEGRLVVIRDQLPPMFWVGRLVAERAMVIGALVLAAGSLLGVWLGLRG
jgi:hypothetical protein